MHYRGPQGPVSSSTSSSRSSSAVRRSPPSEKEYAALLILFFACFSINADQLVAAPNLTRISTDFALSESERDFFLGALTQLGFYVSAGFFSVLSGPLIEVVDRAKLLGSLCVFGSILACCCGLVPLGKLGFFYFLLLRVSTGISVGVALPTAFSLLSDIAPVSRRTTMGAFITTSCAAGAAIGQALSGLLGAVSWRVPYLVLGLVSVIAAVACFAGPLTDVRASTHEKKREGLVSRNLAAKAWRGRSMSEDSTSQDRPRPLSMEDLNWSRFRSVLAVRTNRLIFLQSIPGCIGWSSIATFLPDFLHTELDFSVRGATGVMAVFGISSLVCAVVGSGVGQAIYNEERARLPLFVAASMASGAVFMICLVVLAGGGNLGIFFFTTFGAIGAAAGPNLKGMLMNANSTHSRGTVFALFNLIDNLGKGLGPSVLVVFRYCFGGSRRFAFAAAFSLWFLAAFIAAQLAECINEDTVAVEIKAGDKSEEPFDLFHIYHK